MRLWPTTFPCGSMTFQSPIQKSNWCDSAAVHGVGVDNEGGGAVAAKEVVETAKRAAASSEVASVIVDPLRLPVRLCVT